MRIAFYAPLKQPDHPVPSGDRRMAREIMRALNLAGHDPIVASQFRSWEGAGDARRQASYERLGAAGAAQLIETYLAAPETRPLVWLTYHLYHKAPDWIGPAVSEKLAIPYVVIEASVAAKQAAGPWASGHRAVQAALRRADAVIQLNRDDETGVMPHLASPARLVSMLPFIDTAPFATARATRDELALAYRLTPGRGWLLTVAMMRGGAKLDSYRLLAASLGRLLDLDWQLLVAGDGPARPDVEKAFASLPDDRVRFVGAVPAERLPQLYASADLYLWPAIYEAYGMSFLEAHAAGLPAVAGRERGVPAIVREQKTGLLAAPGDAASFAAATRLLIADPARRLAMGREARRLARAEHDIAAASRRLDGLVERLARKRGA